MKTRCLNPAFHSYRRYGGRGITICPEWRHSFAAFLRDMGTCPPGRSLDRINNDGNYEPGNCRWATFSEQMQNRSKPQRHSSYTNAPGEGRQSRYISASRSRTGWQR